MPCNFLALAQTLAGLDNVAADTLAEVTNCIGMYGESLLLHGVNVGRGVERQLGLALLWRFAIR